MLHTFNAFATVMMVIRTTCLRTEEFFQVLKQPFSIKTTQLLELKEEKYSVGALRL